MILGMKFNNWYDYLILFILLIKIIYAILVAIHIYLKIKGRDGDEYDSKIVSYKDQLEIVFVISMSILLLYLFYPKHITPPEVDTQSRLLLFLYGIIILFTLDWTKFIDESSLIKFIKDKFNL
jgi:heme/copper-type cytochrome/quinol oxidase subunit 2